MRAKLFLIPLLLSSAACKEMQAEAVSNDAAPTTSASSTSSASASAKSGKGVAVRVAENTELYEFSYAYPAAAGAYPTLRAYLDKNLATIKANLVKDATEAKAGAEKDGFPYHAYSTSEEWTVVTDLPRWLSLSVMATSYTGGAHGNYGMGTLLFDKQGDAIREPMDLFISSQALRAAVEKRYCAGLDKERAKRRGGPVDKSDETFGGCPLQDELVLLLGSSNGKTFDRMTLYAGPYIAGPYVEGDYEVNIDVDAAVLKAVKPEFAKEFAIRR